MKIKRIEIERFGSLRQVTLTTDNFTVLIGKNGSGKSFVLEGLFKFFNEFSFIGGGSPTSTSDYFWWNRNTNDPLRFKVLISMNTDEVSNIFPFASSIMDFWRKKWGEKYNEIEVTRLIDIRTGWKTERLKWGEVNIVDNDKMVAPEEINR